MTREEVLRIAEKCVRKSCMACPDSECPLYRDPVCLSTLLKNALPYIRQSADESQQEPVMAQLDSAPGLISEIMGHYKKPLVNISFQEMEDGEA